MRLQDLTRKLIRVNDEVQHFLDRLPLDRHEKLAELNRLISMQMELVNTPVERHSPLRISLLFENARDKATHLRQRYNEARMHGKLRKPMTG